MKKIRNKPKIDTSLFLYKPEDDKKNQDHGNNKLDVKNVDLTHESTKELSPDRKYQTLSKKKHNVKARYFLKLMRSGVSKQNTKLNNQSKKHQN